MGKKLSPETVEKLAALEKNDSIFAKSNRYGYHININHPKIRPIYEKWKKKHDILIPSDRERFEFENSLINYIANKKVRS